MYFLCATTIFIFYLFLFLRFSMRKMVAPPILVPELSFVHKLWPDKNDLINWDPEREFKRCSSRAERCFCIYSFFNDHFFSLSHLRPYFFTFRSSSKIFSWLLAIVDEGWVILRSCPVQLHLNKKIAPKVVKKLCTMPHCFFIEKIIFSFFTNSHNTLAT